MMKYLERVRAKIEKLKEEPLTEANIEEMIDYLELEKRILKRKEYHTEEMSGEMPKKTNPY